jgi:hypothetical protein
MTDRPLSIPRLCDRHPQRREHSAIWAANRDLPRCGYCGHQWPEAIGIESDNEAITGSDLRQSLSSSQLRSSPSTAGYISSAKPLLDLSRSRSTTSSLSSSSSRGRTANLKQFAHFDQMRQQANERSRAAKETSPFDNTIGLKIRVKPLYSIGGYLPGSTFFKASKTTQLSMPFLLRIRYVLTMILIDSINLPLLPWNKMKYMTKSEFIASYLKPSLKHQSIDESNLQFGIAFEKTAKADTGIFTSIAIQQEPFDDLRDIFNDETASEWAVEDCRIVLWIEIQQVIEDQGHPKPPKAGRQPTPMASRPASNSTFKEEPLVESINLDAFPPDRSIETIEVAQVEEAQAEEAPSDHEEPHERDKGEDPEEGSATHRARKPSRKRSRAHTIDSTDEHNVRPQSRYGRRSRATAKVRLSRA